MKSCKLIGLMATAVGACILAGAPAHAGRYLVSESIGHVLACYDKVYVPATVEYNTRGILVQHPSVDWDVGGDRWLRVRHPAVYIETRRVLEADHYKLVPCQ